jgi:hypothetical protein
MGRFDTNHLIVALVLGAIILALTAYRFLDMIF